MASPIRSRSLCPWCGSALYYVGGLIAFLTGKKRRVCMAPGCGFIDPRRFRIMTHSR